MCRGIGIGWEGGEGPERGEEDDGGRFGWEMRRSGVGCGVEEDGVPPPSGGGRRCVRCMRGMTGTGWFGYPDGRPGIGRSTVYGE